MLKIYDTRQAGRPKPPAISFDNYFNIIDCRSGIRVKYISKSPLNVTISKWIPFTFIIAIAD